MKRYLSLAFAFLILIPPIAMACPNCKDAVANAGDDDDPLAEARAYNHSIYLMVSMPYLLLGGCGLVGYRKYTAARKPFDGLPDGS